MIRIFLCALITFLCFFATVTEAVKHTTKVETTPKLETYSASAYERPDCTCTCTCRTPTCPAPSKWPSPWPTPTPSSLPTSVPSSRPSVLEVPTLPPTLGTLGSPTYPPTASQSEGFSGSFISSYSIFDV
jgi:hypothetical protein